MNNIEIAGKDLTQTVWNNPVYDLIDNNQIKRKDSAPSLENVNIMEEESNLIETIVRYVKDVMVNELQFHAQEIPLEEATNTCPIFVTNNFESCEKLLIIMQNAVGSNPGIWSRSLCIQSGLRAGSMLPCLQSALVAGFGVVILNPNTNSINVLDETNGKYQKVPIQSSSSPEEHALYVWDNIISVSRVQKIILLGYGNGASLTKEILQRQLARSRAGLEMNHIFAIATIEASHLIEEDDTDDVKIFIRSRAVNWEHSDFPTGYFLSKSSRKLGCTSISVGNQGEVMNVATSIEASLEGIFRFFSLACHADVSDYNVGAKFFEYEARVFQLEPQNAISNDDEEKSQKENENEQSISNNEEQVQANESFFSRIFKSNTESPVGRTPKRLLSTSGNNESTQPHQINARLTVSDFDLLKVVGKGAFGKVMLVRKNKGDNAGNIYAMKVLKKGVIAAKGQIEHTKHERAILCEIKHPFIVRLRYAFQNEDKLYLVTDYYSGGSLFFHLRKSRGFIEQRAKFYSAELLLALEHLHKQHIIYRDLKLENILMDQYGHIALTDFGLSKMDVADIYSNQQTTFCGTAEYIAPELLRSQGYGAAVDWWSFGILLYEMMAVRTPFFDKNRKLMFHSIVNAPPRYPTHFSDESRGILGRLLEKDPSKRLGSGPKEALDIREHPFYSSIDWDALFRREVDVPFTPDVQSETDTRYVPKTYVDAEAKDSLVQSSKTEEKTDFVAFTFLGDSAFDQQEHTLNF